MVSLEALRRVYCCLASYACAPPAGIGPTNVLTVLICVTIPFGNVSAVLKGALGLQDTRRSLEQLHSWQLGGQLAGHMMSAFLVLQF